MHAVARRTIPIALPTLHEEEAAAAREAILSGWVTQGPKVKAFEDDFAGYVGAKHAVAVSNCTTALHLALLAVGVRPGDEVVVPSHSFIATANSVRYCNAKPVFVDVDPATFNITPQTVAAGLTPLTKAILAVHQLGMPCDIEGIVALANKHGVPVVEDAACAIGSEVRVGGAWRRVGAPVGRVACFSFHPRKMVTTGDGGMLTTEDLAIDAQFRLLRQHGMNMSDLARHASASVIFEDYPVVGFNYRLTDIQAAVGRVQLGRLPAFLAQRRLLAARYEAALKEIPGLIAPHVPEYARPNFQSYPVRVTREFPKSRDDLMQAMLDQGIHTRRGVMNAHQEGAYNDVEARPLPESERARDEVVLLPMYSHMTVSELDQVVAALKLLGRRGGK